MEIEIGALLKEKNFTISCAESCTGGLLTDKLTNVPGASAYVKGAIVSYTNEIKISALHVNEETLNKFGAVSEQTAREMAVNVRQIMNTDIGISITGIAGPAGGTAETPLGLIYVGVSGSNGDRVQKFKFSGDRVEIKNKAVEVALVFLNIYLTLEKNF